MVSVGAVDKGDCCTWKKKRDGGANGRRDEQRERVERERKRKQEKKSEDSILGTLTLRD